MKALALVVIGGCNWVLDLAPTTELDSASSPPLIVPPDGPTNCPPPPDFSTWSFSPHTLPGFTQPIEFPSFVAADRVIFASEGQLFESGLDGGAVPITSLDLPDSSLLVDPSPLPGADVFWFVRNGGSEAGTYYAVRDDTGWTPHRADFGLESNSLYLGAVAFYAGSIRMPVRRGQMPSMIELESFDGTTWSFVQSLEPTSDGVPTFSSDGCLMLHVYTPTGEAARAEVAARNADGTFGPATALTQVASVIVVAIDPSYRRLWIVDTQKQLYEGLAP